MKIPKKVKIGWKNYDVVKTKTRQVLAEDSRDLYGQIDYNDIVIYINNQYNGEQQKATLIHELIHGIFEMYGITDNEEMVTTLGNGLYAMIVDNPKLFT